MENSMDFEIIEKRKTKTRKVKAWTEHQDRILKRLCQEYPRQWAIISSLIPDRNQNQCLHRYRRICQRGMDHTKNWTQDQDEMVQKLIKRVGKNWKLISQMLGTKTGKQIRERYINKLDPGIKKNAWSKEEDIVLIKCIKEFGSKWSEISKSLPGRPENMIKNRYYSYIKKNYEIRDRPIEKKQPSVASPRNPGKEGQMHGEKRSQDVENIENISYAEIRKESKGDREERYSSNMHNPSVSRKERGFHGTQGIQGIQEIHHMPSIMELQQNAPHTPILKDIQNIELIDIRTFNHFSEHDLFYFLNGR